MLTVLTLGPSDHWLDLEPDRLGHLQRIGRPAARQQHGKFLAAIARVAIAGAAHRIGNADRNPDQHLVAGLVAVGVVVGFEVIGIDHQ